MLPMLSSVPGLMSDACTDCVTRTSRTTVVPESSLKTAYAPAPAAAPTRAASTVTAMILGDPTGLVEHARFKRRLRLPGRALNVLSQTRATIRGMKDFVVDDDAAVRESLGRALRLEGYEVELAADGAEALERLESDGAGVDLVVLDVLMPNVDGLEVCRRLRRSGSRLPVLMLTARDEVADRVAGLDAGADDYVVKPFALAELLARVRALLRRSADGAVDVLRFADIELDPATREVRRDGDAIELTRTEFALLELFMLNPRQVLTRSIIFERVWGYDFGFGSNSLDVYIGYLRRKTEAGGKPRLIQTVRGVGYALRDQ